MGKFLSDIELRRLRELLGLYMGMPFTTDIPGETAEYILSKARKGKWQAKRANRPEPDMVLKGKNYSIKTEKLTGKAKDRLGTKEDIITARPDPSAEFPAGKTLGDFSDDELGELVLQHYNREIVRRYHWDIIAILLRSHDNKAFIYFEEPAVEYRPAMYSWRPTQRAKGDNRNIAGYDQHSDLKFKWTSRGKQLYVVHDIPSDADYFTITPTKFDLKRLLEMTRRVKRHSYPS